jgi:hypothetical protein
MRRTAMDGQRRAAGNVAHLRELADAPLVEARPGVSCWEHFVFPCAPVVPLRAGRDFEGAHVRRHVDACEIEGPRGDAVVEPGLGRGGEVAMPWLVHRPLEGSVEANFDDFVIEAEHGPAHCRDPVVRAEVGKAAEGLRMDLHVPAPRATANSAPGRWIASQKPVNMSSRIRSPQSRENAPFSPTIPSWLRVSRSALTSTPGDSVMACVIMVVFPHPRSFYGPTAAAAPRFRTGKEAYKAYDG